MAWRTGLGSAPHQARFLRARSAGVLASARARCGAGVGRRCGRAFRVASGAGRRGLSRRASRLRHAPPAGAPDPRARCYHLRQIWGSTLGTVVPEVVAARVRRALVATQRRPPYVADSATDVRQPSHGVHSVGAAQLSHALLDQECAHVKMILAASPHGPAFIPGGHVKPSSIHTPRMVHKYTMLKVFSIKIHIMVIQTSFRLSK